MEGPGRRADQAHAVAVCTAVKLLEAVGRTEALRILDEDTAQYARRDHPPALPVHLSDATALRRATTHAAAARSSASGAARAAVQAVLEHPDRGNRSALPGRPAPPLKSRPRNRPIRPDT
ncbi:hypothetical protein [Kitasatospora sp. NPDC057223]|uniref:hypothetical protein n=1 Tax=Kitasatospora sp. NPDC057223 TaxID=3346055 RepID=UPI00362C91A2